MRKGRVGWAIGFVAFLAVLAIGIQYANLPPAGVAGSSEDSTDTGPIADSISAAGETLKEASEPGADLRSNEHPLDPYPRPFARQYMVDDPRAVYDAHIARAQGGDDASMVRVAEAIRNCVAIPSFSSWSEFRESDYYQSGSFPAELEEAYKTAFDQVGVSCAYVRAQKPEKQRDDFTWSNHWYQRAAAAGNLIAELELSLQREHEDRPVIARLLNAAYELDDYRTYYYASTFYAYVEEDYRGLTGRMWQYLGCLKHPQCSSAGLRASLEVEYVPADVELIVGTATRFSHTRPPIDFLAEPTMQDLADR